MNIKREWRNLAREFASGVSYRGLQGWGGDYDDDNFTEHLLQAKNCNNHFYWVGRLN